MCPSRRLRACETAESLGAMCGTIVGSQCLYKKKNRVLGVYMFGQINKIFWLSLTTQTTGQAEGMQNNTVHLLPTSLTSLQTQETRITLD